jgi:hypothetical protein
LSEAARRGLKTAKKTREISLSGFCVEHIIIGRFLSDKYLLKQKGGAGD